MIGVLDKLARVSLPRLQRHYHNESLISDKTTERERDKAVLYLLIMLVWTNWPSTLSLLMLFYHFSLKKINQIFDKYQ